MALSVGSSDPDDRKAAWTRHGLVVSNSRMDASLAPAVRIPGRNSEADREVGPGGHPPRLVQALSLAGFEIGLVNPKRIKAFREAEGRRAKTDRLDAKLIARFALFMTDAIRPPPNPEQIALKALSSRRRQLTELIAMEKTRLKQAVEPILVQSCQGGFDRHSPQTSRHRKCPRQSRNALRQT